MLKKPILPAILLALIASACVPTGQEAVHVILVVDGQERALSFDEAITVGQVLSWEDITLNPDDRVSPPEFTTITEGMVITVVRVVVEHPCERVPIPFDTITAYNEGLPPGERRLAQAGRNGEREVCYRVVYEDGVETERTVISDVVVREPQDEIYWEGPEPLASVSIEGTLAYISNGNAWIMRGNSGAKRPLTDTGDLDGHVFALSPEGDRLIFTRMAPEDQRPEFFNDLWIILDTTEQEPEPIELIPDNVLYAEWVPGVDMGIAYSTAEGRPGAPGWRAYNDLYVMVLDEDTAEVLNVYNLLPASAGCLYGWWGTTFKWSPDGEQVAFSCADGVGLVENGDMLRLLDFPVYATYEASWAWVPTLSWSPDGNALLTTVHGPPFGNEPPEESPIFNVVVVDADGEFRVTLAEQAGIWAAPQFSPLVEDEHGVLIGHIAYLQARDPLNSVSPDAEYELVIADRDGSNRRVIFPEPDQPGLSPQTVAWSPSGRQVALIYQGNLWIIDITDGRARQLTVDGAASSPQWAK